MSNLKQRLKENQKIAMRSRDKQRLGALRLIMAELKRIEVDERIELDDSRIINILDKMLKHRRDAIAQFETAQRDDLISKEKLEMEVIQEFLPTPLTTGELQTLITTAINQVQAQSIKDMGKVIAIVKPQVQGRADMSLVSKQIKGALN